MLIVNLEYVEVLDRSDELSAMITQSDTMHAYQESYRSLQENSEAQGLIREFLRAKDLYEDVQRFGSYHPDYQEIMKSIRSTKRKMDMNEYVANFKIAERNLQGLLDDISEVIAQSVSADIMVPKEGLLFSDGGCASGSCGTGGSCGCKAS